MMKVRPTAACTNGSSQEYPISISTIELINAIDGYKQGQEFGLATCASRCIDNAIQHFG